MFPNLKKYIYFLNATIRRYVILAYCVVAGSVYKITIISEEENVWGYLITIICKFTKQTPEI